jgi:signal transduction histidine kinase
MKFNCSSSICQYSILVLGILLSGLIGELDYITGSEISFSIFYLVPIVVVSWMAEKYYGYILAFICAAIWILVEINSNLYTSFAIAFWNGMVRFSFFLLIVYLLYLVKKSQFNLEGIVKQRTEALKDKSEKLSQLTNKVLTIKEEENSRIARELHDELGQSLTAIKIELAWIAKKNSNNIHLTENLVSMTDIIDKTIATVQKISSELRPRLLEELGLFPAMERYIKEFQKKSNIACSWAFPQMQVNMPIKQAISIYRIFQEAMVNILRHADAKTVFVKAEVLDNNLLVLYITDDGIGLPENWKITSSSIGILGMTERAEMAGGHLKVYSEKGNGTQIKASIPLTSN